MPNCASRAPHARTWTRSGLRWNSERAQWKAAALEPPRLLPRPQTCNDSRRLLCHRDCGERQDCNHGKYSSWHRSSLSAGYQNQSNSESPECLDFLRALASGFAPLTGIDAPLSGRTDFRLVLSLPDDRRFYNVFFLLERSDTVDVMSLRCGKTRPRRVACFRRTRGSMDPLDEPEH